jgi:hypothetical protein
MLTPDVVEDSVRLTFEEMAFVDVAGGPAARKNGPDDEEGPVLYLAYSRPKNGALALFLPKAIKFAVAEAIYGEEWNLLSPVQLDDSLLELLNVLGGRLLTTRFGQGVPYTMGLPTVLYDPPGDVPGMGTTTYAFHVDDHEFSLVWYEESA